MASLLGQQLWLFLPVILADCYGCLKISLREMTPLVAAQGSPQEMPLEVREPILASQNSTS